jgi:hypothetical protein
MSDEARKPGLTPAMRIAIGAVVALVTAGIVAAAVLNTTAGPDRLATSTSSPAQGVPSSGPRPGATPTTGSEVPPPAATSVSGLPPAQPAAPLISAPLPASGSLDGGIVDGYPATIAGPADGSTVTSTSIAVQDAVMQLSLIAVSSASQDDIRTYYRTVWSAAGLREQTAAADGTMTFVGPYESLALSFGSTGTGNHYTVFGILRTQ